MHPSPRSAPSAAAGSAGSEDAVALVHFLLKEVDWIRRLSGRQSRRARAQGQPQRDLDCILELSASVARTMRQFLDRARDADPRDPDVIEVGRLVDEAVARVSRRSEGCQIRVDAEASVRRMRVPGDLLVALVAVLENASDFAAADRPIRVEARAGASVLDISVEDSGAGMDGGVVSACRTRGFTTRAERGGHGFGLYAASRTLSRNGGDLCVESRPGEGTRVLLRLPCPPLPAPGGAPGANA